MWRLVGHRMKKGFLCDLCGSVHDSMSELCRHVHSHGLLRIEPVFLFGAVYGLLGEDALAGTPSATTGQIA